MSHVSPPPLIPPPSQKEFLLGKLLVILNSISKNSQILSRQLFAKTLVLERIIKPKNINAVDFNMPISTYLAAW